VKLIYIIMLRIKINIIFFVFAIPVLLNAQSYVTSAGFRMGDDIGISISQRIAKKNTIELVHQDGLFSGKQYSSLGLKQHYSVITKRLNFFAGGGLYMISRESMSNTDIPGNVRNRSQGLLLTGGMDFTIGRINLGYDWSPTIRFSGSEFHSRLSSSSALTIRYVILPQKSKSKSFLDKIQFWKKDNKK